MEDGSLRCDVNISVRQVHRERTTTEEGVTAPPLNTGAGDDGTLSRPWVAYATQGFGQRVEVKNLNSVRNVVRAVDHEAYRQISIYGTKVVSLWLHLRSLV